MVVTEKKNSPTRRGFEEMVVDLESLVEDRFPHYNRLLNSFASFRSFDSRNDLFADGREATA